MEVEASNRSVSAGLTFKSLANQRWEHPRVPYIPIFSLVPFLFFFLSPPSPTPF